MLLFCMVTECLRTKYLTHEGISKSSWPESVKEYTVTFFISHFCSSLCIVSIVSATVGSTAGIDILLSHVIDISNFWNSWNQ